MLRAYYRFSPAVISRRFSPAAFLPPLFSRRFSPAAFLGLKWMANKIER